MTAAAVTEGVYDAQRDRHGGWLDEHALGFVRGPCTVLDAGCGDGFWASLLTDRGYTVTGIDIRPDAIRAARARNCGASFHVADATEPHPGRFELAFCRTLPQFFNPAKYAAGETRALLRALSVSCRKLLIVAYTNVDGWDEDRLLNAVEEFADLDAVHSADRYLVAAATFGIPYTAVDGRKRRYPHSLGLGDLARLERYLDGKTTVTLAQVAAGRDEPGLVAVRHDVDHSLAHALRFARWEAARGVAATYFLLPTAAYWHDAETLREGARELERLGHEVGLHNDAVAESARREQLASVDGTALPAGFCDTPADLLQRWVGELRRLGVTVHGTAAHGTGIPEIDNQALWAAGYSPADFGLAYEAYHLHRVHAGNAGYRSDNRGVPLDLDAPAPRQTHILVHPEHWALP